MDWDSRIVSNVHAIFVSVMAIYTLFFEEKTFSLTSSTRVTNATMMISAGYFLYDIIIVLMYFRNDLGMIAHHLLGFGGWILVCSYDLGVYIGMIFLLTEISTPFVNGRHFLSTMNMRTSMLYKVNGILMWAVFGAVRMPIVFILPIINYYWLDQYLNAPKIMFTFCNTLYLVISCLNVFWFYKITTGILKVLSGEEEKLEMLRNMFNEKKKMLMDAIHHTVRQNREKLLRYRD
ncbi:5 TM domain-containing transmembrane protein [Acrasis kona]|uniref:5 TM domain-containing transmembrane protein n=1 Tax=Acrasis kona TaxID=1008807 RepID=A0AAW2ZKG1_9EUKA